MAMHLVNLTVKKESETICSQGHPQLLQSALGETLGEGQPAFLTLQAACQSRDVARCLRLQTAHLRAHVPGMARRWCCQQLHRSFVALSVMERNKAAYVAVSQGDLVALA